MITSTGSAVGINTATPFGKFNVVDGTNKSFVIQDSGNADTIELINYSTSGGVRAIALDASVLTFGTGTAGGGSVTERIRITSSGSVGIGTSTPSGALTVANTQNLSSFRSTTATNYCEVQIENSTNYLQIGVEGATPSRMGGTIAYNAYLGSYNNYGMTFHTNNLNRMTITSAGNIGIGTSSPTAWNGNQGLLVTQTGTGNTNTIYSIQSAATSVDTGSILEGFSTNTTSGSKALGSIVFLRENTSTTALSSYTAFYTNYAGTVAERMRITSAGNVGIGTNTPGASLQIVGGDMYLGSYHAQNKIALGADTNHYVRYNSSFDGAEVSGYSGVLFTTLGGTERMRISTYGDVYIGGTTSLLSGALIVGDNSSTRPIVVRGASGVDGAYITGIAFYPWNTAEVNTIQTTVSGSATASGFRFMVSNGYGTTGTTESLRINRTSVTVIGSLSKGSGSFKIDHPIESMSDTHHLVHSFVESPQANNIYRGKVQLINGKADINLDEVSTMTEGTFVLLNRNIHTYTSNETDWDAVRGKINGNILTIECENNQSTALVSWLVIGERKDKHMYDTDWTDENGKVIVEPLKNK